MLTNDLLTSGQVAKELGVDRTTVHHWAKDGKLLVAHVINGTRLFARSEVDRLAASRAKAQS